MRSIQTFQVIRREGATPTNSNWRVLFRNRVLATKAVQFRPVRLRMWSEITSPICTGGFGRTASLQDACLASCTARLAPSRASQLLGANRELFPTTSLGAGVCTPEGTTGQRLILARRAANVRDACGLCAAKAGWLGVFDDDDDQPDTVHGCQMRNAAPTARRRLKIWCHTLAHKKGASRTETIGHEL